MPKDLRVKAAHKYKEQPKIQIGYKRSSGGLGTVRAIVIEQPIEIAHAKSSIAKRRGWDFQSSCIHLKML